jgi:hypothetical protein
VGCLSSFYQQLLLFYLSNQPIITDGWYATNLIKIKTNKNPQDVLTGERGTRNNPVIVTNDVTDLTKEIKGINFNDQGR